MNTWSIIYCSMKRCYVILFMFQKITNLQHTMGFSLTRSQFVFCCAIHEYVRRTLTCSESQKRISEISTELSGKRHEKLIGAFHLILRVRTLYICVSYSNSTAEHRILTVYTVNHSIWKMYVIFSPAYFFFSIIGADLFVLCYLFFTCNRNDKKAD